LIGRVLPSNIRAGILALFAPEAVMAEQIPDDKPLPPGDYECCESGCDRCVWDIYREDVAEWEAAQKADKEKAAVAESDLTAASQTGRS
tara:strand:+ start:682 stop:948 length:267 start_codon:yes stop_codon:yes gene_type:complete